jgi:ubiquinone/menaquinone biosynthesis C-methylase UbiE
MDTEQEARDYDAMDHAEVNARFCADLLATAPPLGRVLDVGTGTALIPIELCRRYRDCVVDAIDLATHMLALAERNVAAAGFANRVTVARVDAKATGWPSHRFDVVMSNSIVHHIPEPDAVLAEMVRVLAPGGWLFIRDLLRPATEAELRHLVATYAGDANAHQRQMFADSLHAALTLAEVRDRVAALGYPADDVRQTSDRHWTWAALRRGS